MKSEGVKTSFFSVGESKRIVRGENQESPIAKFISKRGEGMHHIAFYVDDIEKEMERLKENGFHSIREYYTKGQIIS